MTCPTGPAGEHDQFTPGPKGPEHQAHHLGKTGYHLVNVDTESTIST